ncbi:MAG: DUF7000 family protein [Clostridium sp.]
MRTLKNNLEKYKELLEETDMQTAYKELITFIKKLQRDFKIKYPEYEVAKGMYQGYLDLSFFAFTTKELKAKQLKIEVVYLHKEMRFEAWLSGRNRTIMSAYNQKLNGYNLGDYLLANDEKGMDSIIEGTLVDNPDFDNLKALKTEIYDSTVNFVNDINAILSSID